MNGFKNTKTGPIYGDFNLSKGTPKCGEMPQRFATGGLVSRAEPSNELDAESGGKTPLRPGYSRGGKAKKYAEGGKVGQASKVTEAMIEAASQRLKKRQSKGSKEDWEEKGFKDLMKSGYGKFEPVSKPKKKYAEGGKVGALQAAMKAKPAIKAMRDATAKDVKADKATDKTGYEARRKAFFEARRSQRPASSGPAVRDTKTGRFAKGGMVGCGFNRTPMIGK